MKKYKPPLVGNQHETVKDERWIADYGCGCTSGAKAKARPADMEPKTIAMKTVNIF